jgi:alpha-beta hydrolase superfamily lysophospholipase
MHINTFHWGKETLAAISIGIISTLIMSKSASRSRRAKLSAASNPTLMIQSHTPSIETSIVSSKTVFTEKELEALESTWGSPPLGQFLKDRHGFTHYVVDECADDTKSKGMIVLAHGLGTSLKAYDDAVVEFNKAGYTVLRYDFYNHGYSKYHVPGKDKWISYSIDVFIDQVEDLILHVSKDSKTDVICYIGHSTGGLVGPAANLRWSLEGSRRSMIPNLVLLAPALYAKKPFIAKIADAIPGVLTGLMRRVSPARSMVYNAYLEAGEIAFGHDDEGKTIHANEEHMKNIQDYKLFGKTKGVQEHPFIASGLLGINCHTLRGDLLPKHRQMFVEAIKVMNGKCKILHLWGNRDKTVPIKENVDEIRGWEKENELFTLKILPDLGHELLFEDCRKCALEAISFLEHN